jgi:hypothetical protein
MKQLTPEQIKTLEDAFAGIKESDREFYCKFASMEGVQQQLDAELLEWSQKHIYYMRKGMFSDGYLVNRMTIGEQR